ncbi:MAG: PhnD/SsuA/transferrin family substrate-binding protein [Arenimonas sp.]
MENPKIKHAGFLTGLLLMFASMQAIAATYTLTVEPNYPPAQAQEVYKPLLSYLSKSTGQTFELKIAPNYHVHWRDMRSKAKVDFTFEEAHFTDYRAKRQRMIPLVRVVEPTKYTLLVSDEMAAGGAQGLIGHRITSMSSPSLGYLLLGEIYRNPIAQPEIKSFAANLKDGVEMIFAGESDGAMVPSYIADQYSNLQPAMVTRELPGRALSAHESVPVDIRNAVKNAMLKLHLDNNLYDVISELGTAKFVPTNAATYAGSESILSAAYGYAPPSYMKNAPAPTPVTPTVAPAKKR